MRAVKILLSLGVSLLLAGCVQSLHPLVTKDKQVFRPELVGTWVLEDGEERATFSPARRGLNSYQVTYTEREWTAGIQGPAEKD